MKTQQAHIRGFFDDSATHTQAAYRLTPLKLAYIPAMVALQTRVGTENVVKRDAQYYRDHFAKGQKGIGIISQNDTLVAHALIFDEGHQTTMLNVLVDPRHQRQGLHSALISQWMNDASLAGLKHSFARVREGVDTSKKNFEKAGMIAVAYEPSPEPPYAQTYLLHKALGFKPLLSAEDYKL